MQTHDPRLVRPIDIPDYHPREFCLTHQRRNPSGTTRHLASAYETEVEYFLSRLREHLRIYPIARKLSLAAASESYMTDRSRDYGFSRLDGGSKAPSFCLHFDPIGIRHPGIVAPTVHSMLPQTGH